MNGLPYRHVDVFASEPFSGNGLAVFPDADGLSARLMLRLTQELRQFESVFLAATADPCVFDARVFTVEEELPFAGHPALGAGAVIHEMQARGNDKATFVLALPQDGYVSIPNAWDTAPTASPWRRAARHSGAWCARTKKRPFLMRSALNRNTAIVIFRWK